MLPRVLENEAMDTIEEAVEYDRMDHSGVNGRFVADFLQVHGPCRGGEILDVGTGTARIPIALCQADASTRVVAIDLSETMLEIGRRNVAEAGLSDRIRLRKVDGKHAGLEASAFEGVICNTIVHHLPNPRELLSEMARLVAPGGTLMVRDLFRPADDHAVNHLVETHAAGESPKARALFDDSLRAGLTLSEIQEMVESLGLPATDVSMTSDRHWTWVWNRPA